MIGSDTTAPYEIVWNNVPAGSYALFARTIANNGAEATSKQADLRGNHHVNAHPDPGTNSHVDSNNHGYSWDDPITHSEFNTNRESNCHSDTCGDT